HRRHRGIAQGVDALQQGGRQGEAGERKGHGHAHMIAGRARPARRRYPPGRAWPTIAAAAARRNAPMRNDLTIAVGELYQGIRHEHWHGKTFRHFWTWFNDRCIAVVGAASAEDLDALE